jgi:ABC-type sugar transport system permease subunit
VWVLILPAGLILVGLYLLPNVLTLLLAFTDWNTYHDDINFVGFDNFAYLFQDGSIFTAVRVTVVYGLAVVVFQNVFALALALALERSTRSNTALRALFFVPVLVSSLAAGYVFHGILSTDGPVNTALGLLGIGTIEWLGSTAFTVIVVAFVHAWKWTGITMLVYIAGLTAIPRDYVEAARVDGASAWQQFRHIKLPLLAPAITFNVVIVLIGAFSAFDIILSTTAGGPGRATEVLNLFVYRQFGQGFFGISTAISMVLLGLVFFASVPVVVFLRRREVAL